MPEPRWEQKTAETKITMPPDLLNKSPEEFDEWIAEQAGQAVNKGFQVLTDLETLKKKIPVDSSKQKKAEELTAETTKATEELQKDLTAVGVEPEKAEGWTADRIAKLRKKIETRKDAEERQERLKKLGEVRARLVSKDQEFMSKLGELDASEITGQQEKQIQEMDKAIEAEFKKTELTEAEKMQLLYQLPNFLEAKKKLLDFQKDRLLQQKETVKKRYKSGALQPDILPGGKKRYSRLIMIDKKLQDVDQELEKYNLAA
ncbi:MAG: hypothetical protein GF365_03070 [Candidatus Buchananbacteria bacterium]|nr:hypothetical protein [Candidatus Buchananbacteria bacterium]